jgi:hypothetical protein
MPAVPSWAPAQFDLTSPGGNLSFNVQTSTGLYLLDRTGCTFEITVRETTDNVPQSNGSIPHRRFLTGTQMQLAIVMMENEDNIACDDLLATMLDDLTDSFRSLLNSGDNEGRLAWAVAGKNTRMLDDIRLKVYPVFEAGGALPVVNVTIDSEYPYAQDLTPVFTSFSDGVSQAVDNTGSAEYWPVFRVDGTTSSFTISNLTTGVDFVYDSSNPGGQTITSPDYAEINTFRNTIYLNGDGADLAAGITELESDYWPLITGEQTIIITGADMVMEWAPAYG